MDRNTFCGTFDQFRRRLKLEDVTLVMVETREHELARLAIVDCLAHASFGDILILTDNMGKFGSDLVHSQARFHEVIDFPDKIGWARAMWHTVPPLVRTSHMLCIQWDSWIVNPQMWTDSFMQYDLIGSPWWYKDGKNVGNTGFCLKSTRLARYISDRRWQYPCITDAEDDLLCRKYRFKLEESGFLWAPETLAHQFAFECERKQFPALPFGFHGMFNWGVVLPEDRLRERVEIALRSAYIGKPDSRFLRDFCSKNPDFMRRFVSEATVAKEEPAVS